MGSYIGLVIIVWKDEMNYISFGMKCWNDVCDIIVKFFEVEYFVGGFNLEISCESCGIFL